MKKFGVDVPYHRPLTDAEQKRIDDAGEAEKQRRLRDDDMDASESQNSLRNPDGSLNTAAIYRRWQRADRKRA